MLKKLRIKFILITMSAVILTLAVIMTVVNVINFANINKDADEILKVISSNGGEMPKPQGRNILPIGGPEIGEQTVPHEEAPEGIVEPEFDFKGKGIDNETPFDTRYFTIKYANGEVSGVNCDNIYTVSSEKAVEMANSVLKKGRTSGYYGDYRYSVTGEKGNEQVVFLDYSRQLTPTRNFMLISIIVAICTAVVVFVIIFFLSKKILRPISESYERQKRFVTDAGHELKTPLTIISANNEIIEMVTGEEECTGVIKKQVAKLTSMVSDLTQLAKLDEEVKYNFEKIDLSDAADEAAESLRPLYEKEGKKLETEIENGITINGDVTLINKMIMILFENAYKYSLTYTKIRLFSNKKSGVNLIVENDAEGVETGKNDKCFERFYRSAEARASGKEGSGIGLSVAKEIVTIHKGKISAEGKEGGIFEIKVAL